MARKKADSTAGLYRLSAASSDCTLFLPEKIPVFSPLHLSLLGPQKYFKKLTAAALPFEHRLRAPERWRVGELFIMLEQEKTSQFWRNMKDATRKVEERCKGLN
jgi:hypothetical protein